MGTRTRVNLFLLGTWLTFLAFLLFVFLAITGSFSLFTGTALVMCFILNWILSIWVHTYIAMRAEKMRQKDWLFVFNIVKRIPFVLNCIDTAYVVLWPGLPEQERVIEE
jgi:hypothetical protein